MHLHFSVILAVALIFSVLSAVVMMLFSGFIVDLLTVFKWLSWIQWLSACRYGSNVLIINEFQGLTFCLSNNTHICPVKGEQVIDDLNLAHGAPWDLWKNIVALIIMSIILLVLTYIQLIRIKKTK